MTRNHGLGWLCFAVSASLTFVAAITGASPTWDQLSSNETVCIRGGSTGNPTCAMEFFSDCNIGLFGFFTCAVGGSCDPTTHFCTPPPNGAQEAKDKGWWSCLTNAANSGMTSCVSQPDACCWERYNCFTDCQSRMDEVHGEVWECGKNGPVHPAQPGDCHTLLGRAGGSSCP